MNKSLKKCLKKISNLSTLLSLILISYCTLTTYAYFTSKVEETYDITLGDMESEILIDDVDVNTGIKITIDDLMYLNDNSTDIGLLNEYGTFLTIKITNNSLVPQKVKINIKNNTEGLFYFIHEDLEDINYNVLLFDAVGSNNKEKLSYYNYYFNKELYENEDKILQPESSITLKIVFFGIYDYLNDSDKLNYKDLILSLNMNISCIQYNENGVYTYE